MLMISKILPIAKEMNLKKEDTFDQNKSKDNIYTGDDTFQRMLDKEMDEIDKRKQDEEEYTLE